MNKTVTKTESTALTVGADMGEWGSNEMSSNDIVIPKILLQQGLSEYVTQGKAAMGDYVDSVTGEKLGSVSQPLDAIPFHMAKTWAVQKFNGKKWEYQATEKMTPQTEGLPFDFLDHDGNKMRRIYTYTFYLLVPGKTLPYAINFASSSRKAGQELATLMYTTNAINKLPPPAKVISLGGKIDKNDDGTYAVKKISTKRDASQEEIAKAFEWFRTIKGGAAQVHEAAND